MAVNLDLIHGYNKAVYCLLMKIISESCAEKLTSSVLYSFNEVYYVKIEGNKSDEFTYYGVVQIMLIHNMLKRLSKNRNGSDCLERYLARGCFG